MCSIHSSRVHTLYMLQYLNDLGGIRQSHTSLFIIKMAPNAQDPDSAEWYMVRDFNPNFYKITSEKWKCIQKFQRELSSKILLESTYVLFTFISLWSGYKLISKKYTVLLLKPSGYINPPFMRNIYFCTRHTNLFTS